MTLLRELSPIGCAINHARTVPFFLWFDLAWREEGAAIEGEQAREDPVLEIAAAFFGCQVILCRLLYLCRFGFCRRSVSPQGGPFSLVLFWSVYSGLAAVGFLFARRQPKWLAALGIAFAALTLFLSHALRSSRPPLPIPWAVQIRLILDAAFVLVLIQIGYSLFLVFIETEGFRHLRLQAELQLAEQLQTTLVPPLSCQAPNLAVEVRSKPSSKMGGDLADAWLEGSVASCYIADVSGHGIAAGVLMGMVKTAVRLELLRGETLEGVLQALQRVLPGLKEPNSYLTFAGLRFPAPDQVEFSTAGHLPILHYCHRTRTMKRLALEQFPVGLMAGAEYRSSVAPCGEQDLFVLLTDGIVEVTDKQDQEFGLERVERLLLENASRPLAEIADLILGEAGQYGPQIDDQTILLARMTR
jgi:Stage II sporulation protein E (SpoIIE)